MPRASAPVGARTDLDQQLGAFRRLGSPRVDDHDPSAPVHRLLDETHLVDVGFGGVLAPEDDEAGVGEVPGTAVSVVAEGQAAWPRAPPASRDRRRWSCSRRRAARNRSRAGSSAPWCRCLVEEDAAGSDLLANRGEFGGDPVEGCVPRDPFEAATRGALEGVEEPVGVVDPLDVGQPLETDTLGVAALPGWASIEQRRPSSTVTRIPHVE